MGIVLVVILLVIVLVLLALVWFRQRARAYRLRTAPELKPESLVELSVGTAGAGTAALSDPKTIATSSADETSLVVSYRCEVLLRDPTIDQLVDHGYISSDWKVDYARPGKYHVLQSTWSQFGYQYDEWVAIGAELHENVGQWKKLPENTRVDWNESMRADKFIAILRSEQPKSAELRRYRGVHYYLLNYELPSLSGFGPLGTFLKGGPYLVQMWIHQSTGLLARADVIGAAAQASKDQGFPDLEEVFWSYNETIPIEPPPPAPQIEIDPSQV